VRTLVYLFGALWCMTLGYMANELTPKVHREPLTNEQLDLIIDAAQFLKHDKE
jgi:hypothetical protein